MRSCHTDPVTNPGRQTDRQNIYQQLYAKIKRNQRSDSVQRDRVLFLKSQKQQRRKIIDNRLHDVANTAG